LIIEYIMYSYKPRIIDERRKIPSFQKNLSTSLRQPKTIQYDLKENTFDPSKSSPPNDFMIKLSMRMSIYETGEVINDAVRKRA